jgi:hypothetical protein
VKRFIVFGCLSFLFLFVSLFLLILSEATSKMQVGKGRKSHNPDAENALSRIAAIRGMFKDSKSVPNKSFESAGFMYLSRFNKDEENMTKVREKVAKSVESEEQSVIGDNNSVDSQHSQVQNSSEKNRKYALSLATLATKAGKRIGIVSEGAINVLIELAQQHDKTIQLRCASAFASLSSEPSIRQRMMDDGALAAVIQLASNSNIREIKVDCCRAICNLCCVPNYEWKMVKDGVPFAIMNIAAACPETYSICLQTLVNMSAVNDKYSRIEDVTEAAIYFTNMFLNEDQEILLLSIFCNLSSLRNNQLRLVEDGCLRIVEKYYKSKSNELRRKACEMLKNFTADYRSRAKLIEINIISIVVEMSKDPDDMIRVQSAKCFLFLSKDRNFRKKIIRSDAFLLIMDTSRNGRKLPPELGQIIAKIIRILCADLDLAEKLVHSDVGNALIALLASEDIMIQQYCIESLCSLFQKRDLLARLITDDIHDQVVKLAGRTKVSITKEWCAFALYQLIESRLCSSEMMETAILPSILQFSTHASTLAKSFCAASLAIATLIPNIDCSNSIPLLVNMLNDSEGGVVNSVYVKKYCAAALFNMANKERNCLIMFEANALKPVVELTAIDETKVICAGIISRLSLHPIYYSQFAVLNVLKVLLELSLVDDRITQRRVVNALSNLSQNEELRTQLLQLNPISYIISLASERDEYLRRGCIAIVCNLSYLIGSEKSIVQAGIIPTLMITSLIATDQVISRIICVKAMVNLMNDRSLYHILVQEGAIWALSKLALMDNDELLTLCSTALCRLSCFPSYARMMLQSSSTIKTVLNLMKKPIYRLKMTGARILTNLLLETNETDESFRQLMVENMSHITTPVSPHGVASSSASSSQRLTEEEYQSYQEEMNELSVVCLCLASQSETCRITIVQTGMLQKIDPSTIFSSNRTITFAYVTMFSNIANNPMMRNKVLDNHFVERMERILTLQDPNLDLTVIKAMYCLSCSMENTPKLISQDVVPFIKKMLVTPIVKEAPAPIMEDIVLAAMNTASSAERRGSAGGLKGSFASIRETDSGDERENSECNDSTATFSENNSPTHQGSNQIRSAASSSMFVPPVAAPSNRDLLAGEKEKDYISRVEQLSEPLRNHLIATLYNLTTSGEVAHTLVSNGIMEVFLLLWPFAQKDPKMAKLILLATCHLACGKTNSSRMVREGCTKILCFIVEYKKLPNAASFNFPYDVYLRVSSAFRNLLSVVGNQKLMVNEGCLPVLITLATQAINRTFPASTMMNHHHSLMPSHTNTGGLSNKTSMATIGAMMLPGGDSSVAGGSVTSTSSSYEIRHIRMNCAAALKSLTFNSELRPLLTQSDAMDIILAEIKKENDIVNISNGLLKELEAEAWDNGGRGKQKDGRAKALNPCGLFQEFLIGISKVRLDVSCKDVELKKYHVQVLLEDDVSVSDNNNNIHRSSTPSVNTRSSFMIMSPTKDDHNHNHNNNDNESIASGMSGGGGGGDSSPHPTTMTRWASSSSIQRNKLKKLASQMSLVQPTGETPANNGSVGGGDGSQFGNDENDAAMLSIDQLTPFEDSEDTIGLTASRYGKKECQVIVNTLALIHTDNVDENTNAGGTGSNGKLDLITSARESNGPHSARPQSASGQQSQQLASPPPRVKRIDSHSTAGTSSTNYTMEEIHSSSEHHPLSGRGPVENRMPMLLNALTNNTNTLPSASPIPPVPTLRSQNRTNTNNNNSSTKKPIDNGSANPNHPYNPKNAKFSYSKPVQKGQSLQTASSAYDQHLLEKYQTNNNNSSNNPNQPVMTDTVTNFLAGLGDIGKAAIGKGILVKKTKKEEVHPEVPVFDFNQYFSNISPLASPIVSPKGGNPNNPNNPNNNNNNNSGNNSKQKATASYSSSPDSQDSPHFQKNNHNNNNNNQPSSSSPTDLDANVTRHRLHKQRKSRSSLHNSHSHKSHSKSGGFPPIPGTIHANNNATQPPKSTEEEHMKTIVAMIKRAKDTKDSTVMEDVIKEWVGFSRF